MTMVGMARGGSVGVRMRMMEVFGRRDDGR